MNIPKNRFNCVLEVRKALNFKLVIIQYEYVVKGLVEYGILTLKDNQDSHTGKWI